MLKQWIALTARSDWLAKLRISPVLFTSEQLGEKIASRFASATSDPASKLFFSGGVHDLTVLVYTKTTMHLSVS